MAASDTFVPTQLPLLSKGKHRSPRKGACFMELASYLAGERWSDHPSCTHPMLSVVARSVNDQISDEARPRLAPLIPSVIGLVSDDPLLDARLALLCARKAYPVVSAGRQRVMAAGISACERHLSGRPLDDWARPVRRPAHLTPFTAQWTYRFASRPPGPSKDFRRDIAPAIISRAVEGIALACTPDRDQLLYELLVEAINEVRAAAKLDEAQQRPIDADKWADACALTGLASGA